MCGGGGGERGGGGGGGVGVRHDPFQTNCFKIKKRHPKKFGSKYAKKGSVHG